MGSSSPVLTIPEPTRPPISRAGLPLLRSQILPGLGPTAGLAIFWVSTLVLLPLSALLLRAWGMGPAAMLQALEAPRTLAALKLSFGLSALAAAIDVPLGLLLAWILVRIPFPGRKLLDGLIDLPFALPTAVAGITLATLYGPNGWIGKPLAALGIQIAFTPAGIALALVFIGLPFVVRSTVPVLADFPAEQEAAAETLGATGWQTFRHVVFPALVPALLSGFGLAFARGVGEYGSVIFISGNVPMVSEIAPLLIVIQLQQFQYASASCIGITMLFGSAISLAAVSALQRRYASPDKRRRHPARRPRHENA